jgi:hypothetical protein
MAFKSMNTKYHIKGTEYLIDLLPCRIKYNIPVAVSTNM